jgi:hypothetical protein
MTWGFPRRLKTMKPTSKPLKVNNTRRSRFGEGTHEPSFGRRFGGGLVQMRRHYR